MKPISTRLIRKIINKGLEELPEEAKFSGEVTAQDSIFKTCSQESCEFECQVKKSREICQCTQWNIPTATHPMENPVICDLYGNYCFNVQMRNADQIVNCIEQCPSSCNDVCTGKSFKYLFLHQLTHNMTKDCPVNYQFST